MLVTNVMYASFFDFQCYVEILGPPCQPRPDVHLSIRSKGNLFLQFMLICYALLYELTRQTKISSYHHIHHYHDDMRFSLESNLREGEQYVSQKHPEQENHSTR